MSDGHFELVIAPTARRQLSDRLPEAVAFAAYAFIIGRCSTTPAGSGRDSDRHLPIDTAHVEAPTGSSTESTNPITA